MKKIPAAVSAALLFLIFQGCGTSTGTAAPEEKAVLVEVEVVELKSIKNELSYPGQVKASESVAVISKTAGKIDEVFFNTGDAVKAGDVLFTLELTDIENNIKAVEAQLGAADAAVRAAQTGVAQANTNAAQARQIIGQRELALEQAQLACDNALRNHNRALMLFDIGDLSQNDLNQSETALNNAEIAVAQALSALEQTKSSYSESALRAQDALAQAVAQRDSVLISLETAEERRTDAAVKTPITGVVGSRNAEPHMMLSSASVPFFIVQTDIVEISVQVTETLVNRLSAGDTVSVSISAAGADYEGRIKAISPAANEITSTFEVRVEVANKSGDIKPGMYAEVFFVKEQSSGVPVIPRGAVIREDGVPVVYIVENGRSKKSEVSTGIDTGTEIEIIAGLNPGDTVVVKGQNYLRNDSLIRTEGRPGDAA
ncbi:MAG: efflux RND transporter periplasmic adaptor subunit [Oscillospiraceae bacterium]|nr:efflux RND transporter periplasmic adaptor subunit [Oscillospiraceae bacterium]